MKQSSIDWIRLLFPSWRFFESFEEVPVLFHRIKKDGEWTPWTRTLPFPKRKGTILFFNPQGNTIALFHSLFQRLVAEINEGHFAVEQSLSFQLIQNIVERYLSEESKTYQFRIAQIELGTFDKIKDDHLITGDLEKKC
tara:strand:+ start:5301 stop:5717 length:417 start_codon:yes stop_codon:yes gene_type:complete